MSSDVERLEQENADLRALFEMQWRRMGEATDRWRAEDPKVRAMLMPDLGDLLQWLMADADRFRRRVEALEKLVICYRIGRHPSEALLAELDQTRVATRGPATTQPPEGTR